MGDSWADGAEAGEVVDHELTRVLHEHAQVLEEQSRALVTTGAASISVPGVLLHARLRIPRRWRKGLLEITSEDPSSGVALGTSSSPLSRACAATDPCPSSMRSQSSLHARSYTGRQPR